ncbi:FAD:protein FMN transferase [Neptunicella marina]|uniref:FAD:protein FMN transferase n=2 Tax=Neptunicella marina TaxID=2125989 RepID=A0A8J6IYF0_9ALTE|nr:FAD:protein FMN transferase [Neptunicella marina]
MASPCELLIDTDDMLVAQQLVALAYQETKRIEQKFSRYLPDNIVHQINSAEGNPVAIDDETFKLLSFADTCYQISQGMFDITSGVLRKAWRFDGSDKLPDDSLVQDLMPFIGWQKIHFDQHQLRMPKGYELDFGGIGKEYAVDKVAQVCLQAQPTISILINFGGDIQITRARDGQQPWVIGIENPLNQDKAVKTLSLYHGGMATSGDSRRYLLKNGERYSHILNPHTGYPVKNAPRSVTVIAEHCIQAGLLATLALLQGEQAEAFLKQQQVQHWCMR